MDEVKRKKKKTVMLLLLLAVKRKRSGVISRTRLDLTCHFERLLLEGEFERYYRMTAASFERLLGFIGSKIKVNKIYSINRTGIQEVTPANKLQMTLSWLGGGRHHDIRALAGVSKSKFYSVLYEVIDAIRSATALQIKFPTTVPELDRSCANFSSKSNNGILTGCVAAVDGWLCTIIVPSASEVKKVDDFFSGHYQTYGVNVQAACDADSRFLAFSCNTPGKTSDSVAFNHWKLKERLPTFPVGMYLVADNAYVNGPHLLTPFTKGEQNVDNEMGRARSAYSFYISQLRIRIEMAFGLLCTKWRIFSRPLQVKFKNVSRIVHACFVLHNFCIDERMRDSGEIDLINEMRRLGANVRNAAEFKSFYDMTVAEIDAREENRESQRQSDYSLRHVMVEHISSNCLIRTTN